MLSLQNETVAVVEALAQVLNGRLGAAASALFESTGRVSDVTLDVRNLIRTLLVAQTRIGGSDWLSTTTPLHKDDSTGPIGGRSGHGAPVTGTGSGTSDGSDLIVQWIKQSRTPSPQRIDSALAALAAATGVSTVSQLVSVHSDALLSGAAATYPLHALWSPDGVEQAVVEQVVRHCGDASWHLLPALVSLATRVVQADMGAVKHAAVLR